MSAAGVLALCLRVLRDMLGLVLTAFIAALVFLLFTEAGAQLALREVGARLGLVHAEGVSGRLWGPIAFERFRYEDEWVRVELEAAQLDWSPLQLLSRRVAVSRLEAAVVLVQVKPGPEPDDEPDSDEGAITELPVALDIRGLRTARLTIELPENEPLHFEDIALDGDWTGGEVRLAPLAATTPWVGHLRLAAAVRLLPDAVAIETLSIDGPGRVEASGRLGYGTPSDLALAWTDLRWPIEGEPQASSAQGSARWQGVFDDWRYTLDAVLVAAGETLEVQAEGSGSLEAVVAERLHVDSGHGIVEARARFDWSETPVLDASGRVMGLLPQHWLAELEGRVNGRFDVQAGFADEDPDLRFTLALDDSVLNDYALTLAADGRYARGALVLQRFDLSSGASRIQASGRAWPELDLDARLDSSGLASLWPPLEGRAQLRARLRGPVQTPHVSGTIDAQQLRYETYSIERLTLSADVDLQGESRLDAELAGLDAGQRVDLARLRLRGRTDAHRLDIDATMPQGNAELTADGGLDSEAGAWRGTITRARIAVTDFPPWTLEEAAPLAIVGSNVDFGPGCIASEIARACVSARPLDGAQRVAFRLDAVQLGALDPWMPEGARIEGRIDGHGYIDIGSTGVRDLRLDLRSGEVRLARNGMPALELLPGRIEIAEIERRLRLDAELPSTRGGIRLWAELAHGAVMTERALSGELSVEVPDLAWLQLLNRELDQVSGRLDGGLQMSGTLGAPVFQGRVQLSRAGARLRTPGITLERVRGSISGGSQTQLVVDAEAWSGDGVLRINGTIDPWSEEAAVNLGVRGEDFRALRTPEASVWMSPDLRVQLTGRELRVTGGVDVPRAEITPKTVDTGVAPSADQIIIRSGDDAEAARARGGILVHADVQLSLGEDVRFDGLGLKAKLRGAVRVIEAPGVASRARGEISLVDGRYKAYGQELAIETGRLLFTGGPPTRPAVELRATRKPRADITVGVYVRGTLDAPEFSLFSTPAMPQERQLSWLVLGRSLDETSGTSDRALVADAALSLGLAGGQWLARRLGGGVVDEVSLGAQPGESSDQAQFTVGKYLSPRLFISYGVALFQPGHSFRLRYDIGKGFKLATETGVESGGDLLYTIER